MRSINHRWGKQVVRFIATGLLLTMGAACTAPVAAPPSAAPAADQTPATVEWKMSMTPE